MPCDTAVPLPSDTASATPAAPQTAALFFDVDGTLIWADERLVKEEGVDLNSFLPSSAVYEAFERLHERGHQMFLCTGRPLALLSEGLLKLGFTGSITCAGSCVAIGNEIVYEAHIPYDVMCETIERLLRMRMTVLLESRSQTILLAADRCPAPGFPSLPIAGSLAEVEQLAPDMAFSKVSMAGLGLEWRKDGFGEFIDRHFTEYDMGLARELSLIGVDKGLGIRQALAHLGRDARNTYAFGDSENDLPMFPAVETPIAMGNAMPVVKERAAYVTGPASGDGIPDALRHFGLI